jgi:hypothetical protein
MVLRIKTKNPPARLPAVGWLQSCIKSFYKAGFSPIQDTAALTVICRRQQAAVIGMDPITERMIPNLHRRFKSSFRFRAIRIFDGRELNLVTAHGGKAG